LIPSILEQTEVAANWNAAFGLQQGFGVGNGCHIRADERTSKYRENAKEHEPGMVGLRRCEHGKRGAAAEQCDASKPLEWPK
jgi:hypothetical protein